MAKPLAAPPIPGVTDLGTLLDFLSNKKGALAYLKTIEEARAEIMTLIETVGAVREIKSLGAKARSERAQAATILADAKNEAATITEKARDQIRQAEEMIKEAKGRLADLDRQNELRDKEIFTIRRELDNLRRTLEKRERGITVREEELAQLTAAAETNRQVIADTFAKMNRAVEGARMT